MKPIAIIPARFGSSRLPGKPLAEIAGKPLIQWTLESTWAHGGLEEVYVATDDARIAELVEGLGGKALMTGEAPSGSDRLAEAAEMLGLLDEVVVNVQGDWPLLEPAVIDAAVEALEGRDMGTAAVEMEGEALTDRSLVKCVMSLEGEALYFSREPIGSLGHLGIYAYTGRFLREYVKLESTPQQLAESLEQLKALEHGYRIGVKVVDSRPLSVDTPSDIDRLSRILCQQNTSSSPAASSPA